MPRPNSKTTEERIIETKNLISAKEEELKQLKNTLKDLEKQKIIEEKDYIYDLLKSNSISIEQLNEMLNQMPKDTKKGNSH